MTSLNRATPGWRFWLLWMSASLAGVICYALTIPAVIGIINLLAPIPQAENLAPEERWIGFAISLFGSAALGAAIGLAQWLVLRRYLPRIGWWVLATLVGYALPLSAGPIMPVREPSWLAGFAIFFMFGAILGLLQWLTLRGRVYQAGWWMVISLIGWLLPCGLIVIAYLTGLYVEPFDMLAAFFVPVAVAGAGIVRLLRRGKPMSPAIA